MKAFYSKSELARFKRYKKFYVESGKPDEVATQYAWDHIHIQRRMGKGSDIKVAL